MSDRADKKRQLIVERAREVFVSKGYRNVTMKDIVEACEISRGGLYLYFENTEQLFRAVIQQEETTEEKEQTKGDKKLTPMEILVFFLKEQKKEILGRKNNLTVAMYEYCFANKLPKKDNLLYSKYQAGLKLLEQLIKACVESGEAACEDYKGEALNMMLAIEGLRIASQTMGVSESMIDREFVYLLQNLAVEE